MVRPRRRGEDPAYRGGFAGGHGSRSARSAMLHYQGQSFELRVPSPDGTARPAALAALEEAYGAEHERTYGHRAGAEEPVELVTLKVVGRAIPQVARATLAAKANLAEGVAAAGAMRRAWFGDRARLAGNEGAQPRRSERAAAAAPASSRSTIPPASCRPAGPRASTSSATSRCTRMGSRRNLSLPAVPTRVFWRVQMTCNPMPIFHFT